MLLEFRVSNFRSIRDEQVFSLIAAGSDKTHTGTHLAATGIKALPHAVRSAVLYGPNASGKSTLLGALDYMRRVVADSATVVQPNQPYNIQKFKLDAAKAAEPVAFEISFLMEGVRYQYALAMHAERFVSESLVIYQTSRPKQLFSRQLGADGRTYQYEFSSTLKGPKQLWQDSTRANALFLSTAAQLNSEMLGPVFRWIVESFVFIRSGAMVNPEFTTKLLETEAGRSSVRGFLAEADISIADIEAIKHKGFQNQIKFEPNGDTQTVSVEAEFVLPVFEHLAPNGSAKFQLHEESEGTQRLYGLAAPVMDVLRQGKILVVDELDSSLHTLLVRQLVSMFHNPDTNKNAAQLIFSTHDTALLDTDLFRRDQIWLTEKDEHQATRLYPLTDFSPRSKEALERGYLAGRYGGIPFLTSRQAQSLI